MLPDAIQPARIKNVVAKELKMSHRKAAHAATVRCHRRMVVKTHLKVNPPGLMIQNK